MLSYFYSTLPAMRLSLLCLLISFSVSAQQDSFRYKFIAALAKDISTSYVSRALAKQMSDSIVDKFLGGRYDTSLNIYEFAYEVTNDLRRVSHDMHIEVRSMDKKPASTGNYIHFRSQGHVKRYTRRMARQQKKWDELYTERLKLDMYDYGNIKILPGNIGYVEIKSFKSMSPADHENADRISFDAVMKYLNKTDALIIDLRNNQGGYLQQANNFCSYFAPNPGTYFINSTKHFRQSLSDTIRDFVKDDTLYTIDKKKETFSRNKEVYVLTSKRTFSAAEIVAYKLKRLFPSVTIVGEKTIGGGNGFNGTLVTDYYEAQIPSIQNYDRENGNYTIEARGVTPDLSVTSDSAYDIAYNRSIEGKGNLAATEARDILFQFSFSKKRDTAFTQHYPEYTGNYQKARIFIKEGELYLLYDDLRLYPASPFAQDRFWLQGFGALLFERDSEGKVSSVELIQPGYKEIFRKKRGDFN